MAAGYKFTSGDNGTESQYYESDGTTPKANAYDVIRGVTRLGVDTDGKIEIWIGNTLALPAFLPSKVLAIDGVNPNASGTLTAKAMIQALSPVFPKASTSGGSGGGARLVAFHVFRGESNSGGKGLNTDLTTQELAPRSAIQILNNDTLLFESLDIGTNNNLDHNGPFGPLDTTTEHGWENGLAHTVEDGLWYSSRQYLAKAGQGGCTIAQLRSNTYFQPFIDRVTAALALLKAAGKIPITYLWYSQGINDSVAGTDLEAWKTDTIAHIAEIRSYLGFVPILSTYLPTAYAAYNSKWDEIASEVPFVHMINTPAPGLDANHWDAAQMEQMAEDIADVCINTIGQDEAYIMAQNYAISGGVTASGGGAAYSTVEDKIFTTSTGWTLFPAGSGTATINNDSGTNKLQLVGTGAGSNYGVAFKQGLFVVGDILRITVTTGTMTSGVITLSVGAGSGTENIHTFSTSGVQAPIVINTTGAGGDYIILEAGGAGASGSGFIAEILIEKQ